MNPNNNDPPPPPPTPPTTQSPSPPSTTTLPQHPLQSLAVITIAGFGGAIAGLSMSRRGGGGLGSIPPTLHHVQQLSNQLPWLWALGCATFAGVIEFSTLVSPTRFVLSTLREHDLIPKAVDTTITSSNSSSDSSSDGDSSTSSLQERILYWDDNSTAILGDYVLGGAFAGAMFKGSQIRPNNTNKNTSPSPSSSSSSSSSSSATQTTTNNTHISEGSIKQQRAIGRGKVVTLATKNQYKQNRKQKKNKIIPKTATTTQKVIKQGTETILKHANKNKASYISGLGPGIALGLFAGLLQIGIGRLNMIMEEYEEESNEQQQQQGEDVEDEDEPVVKQSENEKDISKQRTDDITRQVKEMTTEELIQEIERLKNQEN